MKILGLDIGGANIKVACDSGQAICRPFAIWNDPDRLQDEIVAILQSFPRAEKVAVTMTAELADCFATKSDGVSHILKAVEAGARITFAQRSTENRSDVNPPSVIVWSTEGGFVSCGHAIEIPQNIAAANWHALSTWCSRIVPQGQAILVDIGTTTTDIIPLIDGRPVPTGLTDVDRLQSGELSYSGVRRTPLCAVAHSVPFRTGYCPLAAELFATMLDVYLLTGQTSEEPDNSDTANGKPATIAAAYDRVVRMLCCDRNEIPLDEAIEIARFLADVQRQRLAGSLERVAQRFSSECQTAIVSGSGEFLARQLVIQNRRTANAKMISLADLFSPAVAEAACAFAVAQLAVSVSEFESE